MSPQDTPDDSGIDRGSTETPSEQITAIMRERIASGRYAAGQRVPSTNTLSQEFGVATRTIRKALAPLVSEGLLVTKPGWGTFVRP
jgi:DNA-binding GntR family transcriptional regulator